MKRTPLQIAADMRAMGQMLIVAADEMEQALSATIAELLGDSRQRGEAVKPTPFVPDPEPLPEPPGAPDVVRVQLPKKPGPKQLPYPSRYLSKQEKEQIRLLYSQSNMDRSIIIPQLAETYHTNLGQISAVLFNSTAEARRKTLALKSSLPVS